MALWIAEMRAGAPSAKQTVTFTANKATVDVKLAKPLKAITHVGFSMDSAVVDFSPLVTGK